MSIDDSYFNYAFRLINRLEELIEASHTLDYARREIKNLVADIKNTVQDGLIEIENYDCIDERECCCQWGCACSCHESDEAPDYFERECTVSRDDERFHEKVEENYPWQQKYLEKILGHPTPCETRGCDGTLWVEYIENNRYLVKCSNDCRIIRVQAWSMPEAITNALTRTPKE